MTIKCSIPSISGTQRVPDDGYAINNVLECSRGIAAVWVFMFHIAAMFETSSPTLFAIAGYGHFGVPLFFVISGYCMFASAEGVLSNARTPGSFLFRRLLRVMPPFWLSILAIISVPFLVAAISMVKSGHFEWPVSEWMRFTTINWIEIATLTRAFVQDTAHPQAAYSPINAVYWTLAIELQFYIVVYISLLFKAAWKRVLLAVLILSLAIQLTNFSGDAFFITFWPAFAIGMGLRVAHRKGITPASLFSADEQWYSTIAATLLIAGLLALMVQVPEPTILADRMANLAFTGVAALSAILLWLLGGIEHGALAHNPANWRRAAAHALLPLSLLGQCSYSLYLLHGKLYQVPAMFVRQAVPENSIVYPMLTITFTSIFCYGFYFFFERPFQNGGRYYPAAAPVRQPHPFVAAR